MIMEQAPRYDQINLPPGSRVVFRADVDGRDTEVYEEKLRSNLPFLRHAQEQGWNVLMLGHRRRPSAEDSATFFKGEEIKPAFFHHNESFSNLTFMAEALGHPISYVRHWLNRSLAPTRELKWAIQESFTDKTGQIIFVENDRLWPDLYANYNSATKAAAKGNTVELDRIASRYYDLGTAFQKLGVQAYVFDAISAAKQACGSKSAFAPFTPQIGIGPATLSELEAIDGLLAANIYFISGSKVSEKLPAAEQMIKAGKVHLIMTGGVVGFALRYAELIHRGEIERNDARLGALSNPEHPLHISPEDVDGMLGTYKTLEEQGRLNPFGPKGGVLNPVDFRSADDPTRIVSFENQFGQALRIDESQFDIGPISIEFMQGAITLHAEKNPGSILMVISGTPGVFEKEGYDTGFLALRGQAEKILSLGGRVIGTGSEGNLVSPQGEHVIAGGVSGMFAAGTTPAAFRVFFPDLYPIG